MRQAAMIAVASVKARELGYDTNRLLAAFDTDNKRWNAYQASLGNALEKDPAFEFLLQETATNKYVHGGILSEGMQVFLCLRRALPPL